MALWEHYVIGRAMAIHQAASGTSLEQMASAGDLSATTAAETDSEFNTHFDNSTSTLINEVVLSKVQALRSTHIVMGGFSVAMVVLMIIRIVCDAVRRSKLQVHLRPRKCQLLRDMHPSETFPLTLAFCILVQQIILIAIQSASFDSLITSGCDNSAQIVLPAIFVVGFAQFIFGFDMTIRSLRSSRFPPRGKRATPICLALLGLAIIILWIPSDIWKMTDRCFGDVIWHTFRYQIIAISIISAMLLGFILMCAIISYRLITAEKIDADERISASRMFYYLIGGIILYVLVLPFYIHAFLWDFNASLTTYRIADFALFGNGMGFAITHLFLRVNTGLTVLRPRTAKGPWGRRTRRVRFFGPSDLDIEISPPIQLNNRTSTDKLVYPPEKQNEDLERAFEIKNPSPRRLKIFSPTGRAPVSPSQWPLPPEPMEPLSRTNSVSTSGHRRTKSSYSLFPTKLENAPRLPATAYSRQSNVNSKGRTSMRESSWLYRPPPLFSGRSHKRESSIDTTATVQIGLRLSLAPAFAAAGNSHVISRVLTPPLSSPKPDLSRTATDASIETLDLPIQTSSDPSSTHSRPATPTRQATDSSQETLGLPIQQSSSNSSSDTSTTPSLPPPPPPPAHGELLPATTFSPTTAASAAKHLADARNKVLPPTPRPSILPKPEIPSGLRMNPINNPPGPPPSVRPPAPGASTGTVPGMNGGPEGWI